MCKQSDQSLEPAAEANTVFRKKFSFLSKSCFSIETQCGELCSLRVLLKDDNV